MKIMDLHFFHKIKSFQNLSISKYFDEKKGSGYFRDFIFS